MLRRSDDEIKIDEVPASECARRFADVRFAVVANPHREHFHDLAREIFVWCALYIHAGVKEGEHCRVLRHADQQVAEVTGAPRAKQLVLLEHLAIVPDFFLAGGEMAMPEQRHFFLERAIGRQHAIGPPVGNAICLQSACPQPVEEFIRHWLQPAIARRFYLDSHRFAGFLGQVGGGRARSRKGFQASIVDAGMIERRQVIRDALVINQPPDSRLRRHCRELRDFRRRSAEAGALQQMRRALHIPVFWADGREIAGPVCR